ncbi:MAG: PspC domain-containing protein [Myxococcota bacterium]
MAEPTRFEPTPSRAPTARLQLVRVMDKAMVGGVCSGLARYFQVNPDLLRVGTVIGAIAFTFPVVLIYFAAMAVLPADARADLNVDWQSSSLRATWSGPLLPYGRPSSWLFTRALLALLPLTLVIATYSGGLWDLGSFTIVAWTLLIGTASATLPAFIIALLYGYVPRNWALTLSEDALWIERPTHAPERVPLDQIETFHTSSEPFTIHFKDGRLLTLAPPPPGPDLDVVTHELRKSIGRHLDHTEALDATREERQRVLQVMEQRARAGSTTDQGPSS